MSQVSSYVFFDIETTGLPWEERNTTKIIELTFIAVSRKDIQRTHMECIPPLSKLSLLFQPQKALHPAVVKMTGLSNDYLEHCPLFAEKAKSIVSFLEELPKPVCILAHNGNTFDFKILLAECKDADITLPGDLLCADTLIGFRQLLKGTNICYDTLKLDVNPKSDEILTDNPKYDEILTDDEDEWPELDISAENWQEIDGLCESLSDMSTDEERELKHEKRRQNRSRIINNVFSKSPPQDIKMGYSLSVLYKRLTGKVEPNAHRAECDCLMLLQCAVAMKKDFLPWIDGACKRLTDIKPLVRY